MSTNSKLRKIAEQLPPVAKLDEKGRTMTQKHRVKMLGVEILKQNPNAKDEKGETLILNKDYYGLKEVPIRVDHFEALQYFLRSHGPEGVERYIDKVYAVSKKPRPDDVYFIPPTVKATV